MVAAAVNGIKYSMISCDSDPHGGLSLCVLAAVEKEAAGSGGTVYADGHPSEPAGTGSSSGKPQAGSCLPPAVFYGLFV